MKVGIIRYPGSNCDNDTLRFFKNSFYINHKERKLPKIDLFVIPGGFAFGDRVYQKATHSYKISPGNKPCIALYCTYIPSKSSRYPYFWYLQWFSDSIKTKTTPG